MDFVLYCIVGIVVSAVVWLLFLGISVVYIHGERWLEKRRHGGVRAAGAARLRKHGARGVLAACRVRVYAPDGAEGEQR